ncbi:beta-lactamase family protein [Baekduia soli]|uniref:Beta-lactamase family protein n=1 Tax=Baekduia soli TaxID=496014 RepID=A0A5B8U7F9_9ACTN|nr:serine hydrolase domain-containing protein [Baekduia soli]QEC49024.1 beta-lactamase family protein [Baekduia soli]
MVDGTWDPRWAGVADALRDNFTRGELGAAVSVVVDGRTVVDAWAGWRDEARTRPWTRETAVNVFSIGKPLAAILVLRLVAAGALALPDRVASAWPGFGAAGKGDVTMEHLLTHRAGLPAVAAPLAAGTAYDWTAMCAALAAQEPWWEPGTALGYHTNTYGFLLGEVARRITGRGAGELLLEAIGPGTELWFGAPRDGRPVSDFHFTADMTAMQEGDGTGMSELQRCAYLNPPGISGLGTVNTAAWRAAVIPSTNAHGTARGIAGVYADLLTGGILDPVMLAAATTEHAHGPDLVLERTQRFGLGFQLPLPERPLGRSPHAYGHFGAGGALGFADPDARLAFGYAPNRGGRRWQNPRTLALVDATYDALG